MSDPVSEIDIWTDVIHSGDTDLSVPEASAILRWSFNAGANSRMHELMEKNSLGQLTESERQELQAYTNVGQVLNILQAKARLSLKRASETGAA